MAGETPQTLAVVAGQRGIPLSAFSEMALRSTDPATISRALYEYQNIQAVQARTAAEQAFSAQEPQIRAQLQAQGITGSQLNDLIEARRVAATQGITTTYNPQTGVSSRDIAPGVPGRPQAPPQQTMQPTEVNYSPQVREEFIRAIESGKLPLGSSISKYAGGSQAGYTPPYAPVPQAISQNVMQGAGEPRSELYGAKSFTSGVEQTVGTTFGVAVLDVKATSGGYKVSVRSDVGSQAGVQAALAAAIAQYEKQGFNVRVEQTGTGEYTITDTGTTGAAGSLAIASALGQSILSITGSRALATAATSPLLPAATAGTQIFQTERGTYVEKPTPPAGFHYYEVGGQFKLISDTLASYYQERSAEQNAAYQSDLALREKFGIREGVPSEPKALVQYTLASQPQYAQGIYGKFLQGQASQMAFLHPLVETGKGGGLAGTYTPVLGLPERFSIGVLQGFGTPEQQVISGTNIPKYTFATEGGRLVLPMGATPEMAAAAAGIAAAQARPQVGGGALTLTIPGVGGERTYKLETPRPELTPREKAYLANPEIYGIAAGIESSELGSRYLQAVEQSKAPLIQAGEQITRLGVGTPLAYLTYPTGEVVRFGGELVGGIESLPYRAAVAAPIYYTFLTKPSTLGGIPSALSAYSKEFYQVAETNPLRAAIPYLGAALLTYTMKPETSVQLEARQPPYYEIGERNVPLPNKAGSIYDTRLMFRTSVDTGESQFIQSIFGATKRGTTGEELLVIQSTPEMAKFGVYGQSGTLLGYGTVSPAQTQLFGLNTEAGTFIEQALMARGAATYSQIPLVSVYQEGGKFAILPRDIIAPSQFPISSAPTSDFYYLLGKSISGVKSVGLAQDVAEGSQFSSYAITTKTAFGQPSKSMVIINTKLPEFTGTLPPRLSPAIPPESPLAVYPSSTEPLPFFGGEGITINPPSAEPGAAISQAIAGGQALQQAMQPQGIVLGALEKEAIAQYISQREAASQATTLPAFAPYALPSFAAQTERQITYEKTAMPTVIMAAPERVMPAQTMFQLTKVSPIEKMGFPAATMPEQITSPLEKAGTIERFSPLERFATPTAVSPLEKIAPIETTPPLEKIVPLEKTTQLEKAITQAPPIPVIPPGVPPFMFPIRRKPQSLGGFRGFGLGLGGVFGKRKKINIYADILSVMASERQFGRGTSALPSKHPEVIRFSTSGIGRVPTLEQIEGGFGKAIGKLKLGSNKRFGSKVRRGGKKL